MTLSSLHSPYAFPGSMRTVRTSPDLASANRFVEARNDLTRTNGEAERHIPVPRGVELRTVIECPDVVNINEIAVLHCESLLRDGLAGGRRGCLNRRGVGDCLRGRRCSFAGRTRCSDNRKGERDNDAGALPHVGLLASGRLREGSGHTT